MERTPISIFVAINQKASLPLLGQYNRAFLRCNKILDIFKGKGSDDK